MEETCLTGCAIFVDRSFIWTINAEHVDLDMHFIFVFLNGFASHHPSEKIVNLVDLPNWIIVEVEER